MSDRLDVYSLRCGQPVKQNKDGRCYAQLNVQASNEREARERIIAAGRILGWRLGVRQHCRCASHTIPGWFNGTWVEL